MHPAERLLTALGKARSTYQTFGDSANARPQILHGPHPAVQRRLEALNADGHGIFHCVNHTNLQGRRAENVTAISAYFVDLDGAPMPTVWPLPPTATVESSPGRYHAYWRVTNAPLDQFERVQKHLALLLDGDDKVHDLPRVMRLPGYQHQKAEPFTSTLIDVIDAEYEHETFTAAIALPPAPTPRPAPPPLPAAAQAYINARQRKNPKPWERPGSDPLHNATARILEAREGNRNQTLYRRACAVVNDIKAGRVTRAEAEQRLTQAGLALGLDQHEATRTIQSAMRHVRA